MVIYLSDIRLYGFVAAGSFALATVSSILAIIMMIKIRQWRINRVSNETSQSVHVILDRNLCYNEVKLNRSGIKMNCNLAYEQCRINDNM